MNQEKKNLSKIIRNFIFLENSDKLLFNRKKETRILVEVQDDNNVVGSIRKKRTRK